MSRVSAKALARALSHNQLIFGPQVVDDALLILVYHAGQDCHEKMARLEHEIRHWVNSENAPSSSADS